MNIFESIIHWLFNLAVVTNAVMIYLNINKVWSRKHETIVAESISVGARSIGIAVATTFLLNFILKKDYGSTISYCLFLISDVIFFLIGIGLWVKNRKGSGILPKLFSALRQESSEVGNLLKAFAKPHEEKQLLEILHRLAWLDNRLDERELKYIQTFTETWEINTRDILVRKPTEQGVEKFQYLCQAVRVYLKSEPPKEQMEFFGDLIKALIAVDEEITPEEELIAAEISAFLNTYLSQKAANIYSIIIHPKTNEQENDILNKLSEAKVEYILGDRAVIAGVFHTKRYAEVISESYRDLGWFTVVHDYA